MGEQVQAEMSGDLYLFRVHCVNWTGLVEYFSLKSGKTDFSMMLNPAGSTCYHCICRLSVTCDGGDQDKDYCQKQRQSSCHCPGPGQQWY